MSDGALTASDRTNRISIDRAVAHVLANTAITGALGSLFWLLAPRFADDVAVAAGVSAASLVIVLGFVGQLNMATALSRYLPGAGAAQRSAVRFAYTLAIGFTLLVSAAVLAVGWARGGELVHGADMGLTIAVAVALPLWTIFALQDGALVALRRASVLPVENGIVSLVRIALLPVVTVVASSSGLLVAWLLPVIPAILIVNRLLFARLLHGGRESFSQRGEAARFALTDLPGVVLTVASLRLVPLVVVEAQGSEAGAHIGVAWSILAVSALALPAVSRLALSEMAHAPSDDAAVLERVRRSVMAVVLPASLLAAVGAPLVMRVAGPAYAEGGAVVLAVGAIGLIPAALVELRLAYLRANQRVTTAMWVQVGRAVAMISATWAVTIAGHPTAVGAVFTSVNALALGTTVVVGSHRGELSVRRGLVIAGRLMPGVAGVVVVALTIPQVRLDRVGDAGLVTALPGAWFVGVALIVIGTFACLDDAGLWRAAAFAHLTALVVVLHGLSGMVQPHPRFPVAWLHVGFIDEIASSGALLPQVDGRFSWAGFFSGGALLQQLSDQPNLLWMVRFTPVALNLIIVLAIAVIGPLVGASRRQSFVAAALFAVSNWIGQDYFAPQAVTFVLYLVAIALVLRFFTTDPSEGLPGWLLRFLRPERPAVIPVSDIDRRMAWLLVLVIACALMISHQLSPLFLGIALVALALTRSISLRGLPFIVLGLFVVWLSFSAEAYWVGHLDNIFGSVGKVSSIVQVNVAERSSAPSLSRQLVLRSRLVLSIVLWIVAIVAALRLRRQWRTPVALVCLFLVPFPPLAVQPYGGEMIMRVTLFALPATVLLCARLLVPEGLLSVRRRMLLTLVIVALVPIFILTRYGNERFERVSSDDVALAQQVHAIVPEGSIVYVRNRQTLVQISRVGEVRFRTLPRSDTDRALAEMDSVGGPVYLMFTNGQAAYGELTRGYQSGWLREVEAQFTATKRFVEVAREGEAVLLRLQPTDEGAGPSRADGEEPGTTTDRGTDTTEGGTR